MEEKRILENAKGEEPVQKEVILEEAVPEEVISEEAISEEAISEEAISEKVISEEVMLGLLPAIEALLFAAGDRINGAEIAGVLDVPEVCIEELVERLYEKYNHNKNCGIMIRKIETGYQLCSKPEYGTHISEYFAIGRRQMLSQAAYEALAIIAYGQPATRTKIEKIRGVNSDSAVSKLLERGLICEQGRLDVPGRPVLYGTTDEFLRCFGYGSLQDLPTLHPEEIPSEALEDVKEDMFTEPVVEPEIVTEDLLPEEMLEGVES